MLLRLWSTCEQYRIATLNKNLFAAETKIQYLVNWSFTYQCRMPSFTRALSLPSSSASLSCAVATYSAEAPPRMHQNLPFWTTTWSKIVENVLWILRRDTKLCFITRFGARCLAVVSRSLPQRYRDLSKVNMEAAVMLYRPLAETFLYPKRVLYRM